MEMLLIFYPATQLNFLHLHILIVHFFWFTLSVCLNLFASEGVCLPQTHGWYYQELTCGPPPVRRSSILPWFGMQPLSQSVPILELGLVFSGLFCTTKQPLKSAFLLPTPLFLRQGLALLSRLALSSWQSCLSLPNAGIIRMCPQAWLVL